MLTNYFPYYGIGRKILFFPIGNEKYCHVDPYISSGENFHSKNFRIFNEGSEL